MDPVQRTKYSLPHLHPIPVHFPQGLFPSAFASQVIYLVTGVKEFEGAAYVMLLFAVISLPVTAATGLADWKIRFRGLMSRPFRIKIGGSILLAALALPALLLRLLQPEVNALPLGPGGWIYLLLLTMCQVVCVTVGYYGGRLVFH